MKSLIKIWVIVCSLFLLCSCAADTNTSVDSKPIIYTTFFAMYDFASEIAGDNAEIIQLIPSGSDAHGFEPSASDIAKMTKATALIYCGTGVDSYIDDISQTVEKEGVKILNTSQGIELNGTDPHIWLSPKNARIQYESIKNLMCSIDPSNSDIYEQNFANACAKLDELENYISSLSASAVKKDIIVSHAAYGYLCNELGIEEHGIENSASEVSDPTAMQMADIINFAKEKNISVIFAKKGDNDKTATAVAREINGSVLYLDPFESDTGSGNYFTVMNNNIQALGTALCN